MDLDDSTIENMWSDMAASMEAVERHEVEISVYQADICTTSHDMLLLALYSGSSDIEVGPLLLKLQHLFDWLKAVLHLLVERTLEDLDGMIDVFVNVSSLDHEAPPICLSELETRILDPRFSGKDLYCVSLRQLEFSRPRLTHRDNSFQTFPMKTSFKYDH